MIVQTTRWKPLTHKLFSWGDFYDPKNWHAPRLSENDRQDIVVELNDATNALDELQKAICNSKFKVDDYYAKTYDLLKERIFVAKAQLNGQQQEETIPIELTFPDNTATAVTSLSIETITPAIIEISTDSDGVIKSANGAVTKSIFILGKGLDLAVGARAQLVGSDEASESAGFTVMAAFDDTTSGTATAGATPAKANANYRKLSVTFTPNSARKAPGFAMYNIQLTLDPTKVPPGTTTPPPVSSPPIAFIRKQPDVGLKPVLYNKITKAPDGESLEQTVSANPSAPAGAQGIAAEILELPEMKLGVPLPTQATKVLIENKK